MVLFSLYQNSMVISSVLDCESVWMLTVDILNTICNRDCFADCSLDLTLIVSFWKNAFLVCHWQQVIISRSWNWVTHLQFSTQSSNGCQHVLCNYRQACMKHSHAGIVFTQWSKNGFFVPKGRHIAPINEKFGTESGPSAAPCQISHLSGQKCGNTAPKLSRFRILAINLCLRGNSFAVFLRNSQRLYASVGGF